MHNAIDIGFLVVLSVGMLVMLMLGCGLFLMMLNEFLEVRQKIKQRKAQAEVIGWPKVS